MMTHFQSRNLRERVLLLLFALVVLATLSGHLLGRSRQLYTRWQSYRTEQSVQQAWLSRAAAIEAKANAAAKRLNPSEALSATQLVSELSSMAVRCGLAPEIGSQRSEHSEQLAFHSARVEFRRVELAPLLRFYQELAARSPALALDQFTLTIERSDPGLLNASFQVVAAGLEGP